MLKNKGFTLIEILIMVIILIILTSLAYPSYSRFVMKSRRSEAMTHLFQMQTELEKQYAHNGQYQTAPTLPSSRYYLYSVPTLQSNAYTLRAATTGTQTSDTGCTTLTLDNIGKKLPMTCWQ